MKTRETVTSTLNKRSKILDKLVKKKKKKKKCSRAENLAAATTEKNVPKLLSMAHISFTSSAFWRVHIPAEGILTFKNRASYI
jgi:hypothetical protein